MTDLTRPALRALSVGVVALLAACADGPSEGESSPTAAAPSQPSASTPAQPSTNANPAQPNQDRINLAKCSQPADGKVFFQVGQSVLGVPAQAIRDAIPSNLKPPISKEAVKQELQNQAATGGGCPEKPIDARLLMVQAAPTHPLLDGNIGLLGNPPADLTDQFAQLTRNLQNNPTENCRDIGDQLLGCIGTENRGNAQTQVMYVVTTNRQEKLASGGPLAARCVLNDGKVRSCNLVDKVPGNIAFDATLKAGSYTLAGLRSARDTAAAQVNGLRKN